MQDLMQQIIEMDRKAREITDSAQQEKLDSKKTITAREETMRADYLKEARNRIAELEPQERAAAEKNWEATAKSNKLVLEQMNRLYAEKGDQWVSEIVKRVVGGIS